MKHNKTEEKPFQVFTFLVRDWLYANSFPCGTNGGSRILDRAMLVDDVLPELRQIRTDINAMFEELSWFLMCQPKDSMTADLFYDGRASGLSEEFMCN